MAIIQLLIGPMLMFFPVRRLAQQLQNASLAVLRSNSIVYQIFELEEFGASEKQIKMITDLWLKRVLLLVTNIDDVLTALDNLEGDLYYLLIEKYGEQAKSVDDIILLLNNLWEHANTESKLLKALDVDTEDMMLKVLDIEFMLAKRAKELSVAPGYALGNLEAMAEKIEDAVDDGRGSKTSEDMVIALALPILKLDYLGAMKFAKSFRTITGRYRFLRAFVVDNGISNNYQVDLLIDNIATSKFSGKELASTIQDAVATTGVKIDEQSSRELETIVSEREELILGFEDSPNDNLPNNAEILEIFDVLKKLSRGILLGKDSRSGFPFPFPGRIHPQSGHGHISSPVGSGLFGFGSSSEALKDSIGELLGALLVPERRVFKSKEDATAQMEKDLLKIAEEGAIHRTMINHMPVGEFLEKNPELLSPEARATIQTALAQ